MPESRRTSWPTAPLALATILCIVALAYWPGLGGVFLFDDLANLDALGRYGGVRDLKTFLYYLTSGTADPTGRPVAQLSFLLDATDWPADPRPFKRTNLLIHLANGALLFVLLRRLERWLMAPGAMHRSAALVPLFATLLWVAHPLWVSTTLYVVQRQAMLAATFVLLGLLAWDGAFRRLLAGDALRAWGLIGLGVGGSTVLAGLSKANGFLLPLLALVLCVIVQAPHAAALPPRRRNALRWQVGLGLGAPSAVLLAYLAHQVPAASRAADALRDWSLGERLLSQPRALWDYLGLLVAPRAGSDGVFTDDFGVSRSLVDPWTTLPALVGLVALAWLAIALRRRWPRLAAALLFFLAGHLLESGPVPLELHFEHRNYLPALLMGWPVAHVLLGGPPRRARMALAVALAVAWCGLTWQRAVIWGNPPLQAALWAEQNPASPRAQGYAANWLLRQGRTAEARALLARAEERMPSQVMVSLNRIAQGCRSGQLGEDLISAAVVATRRLDAWNQGTVDWFEGMQRAVLRGECPALGDSGWERLFAALAGNPSFVRAPARQQALVRMEGRAALADADPEAALRAYNRGLDLDPRPELALAQAADLGNAGYPAWGLRHLDYYDASGPDPAPTRVRDMRSLHRWMLVQTGYYRTELDALRAALMADD